MEGAAPLAAGVTTIEKLIHELSQPGRLPDPGPVEVRETHISVLFFTPREVVKVKKPVVLDFLDFRSLESRRHFCHEELRLNRRLSPDVYLGVEEVVADARGRWALDGAGEVVDYAVRMKRLPEAAALERLLDAGAVDHALLSALARRLTAFHAAAAADEELARYGSPEAVATSALDNFDTLERLLAQQDQEPAVPTALLAEVRSWTEATLAAQHDRLARRARDGYVREGHGDLHAGNVFLVDGEPQFIDCLEFSPALRCCDVACDLAFLVMDFDLRGFHAVGDMLARMYAERAADPELPALLDLYKAYRAMVRAKVHALQAGAGPGAADAWGQSARYVALAAGYALGPVLVLPCGPPASGKSWLAGSLRRLLGAATPRSDVVRKQQAGLVPTASAAAAFGAGIYDSSASDRVYEELLQVADRELARGRSVIVDASFARAGRRAPFLAAARARGIPAVIAVLDPPPEVVAERLDARSRAAGSISDADAAVEREMRARFEWPRDEEGAAICRLAGTEASAVAASAVLASALRSREAARG